jgi:hypothetical protein
MPCRIAVHDQLRQLSFQCALDFAAPLAQFGFDEGHVTDLTPFDFLRLWPLDRSLLRSG